MICTGSPNIGKNEKSIALRKKNVYKLISCVPKVMNDSKESHMYAF